MTASLPTIIRLIYAAPPVEIGASPVRFMFRSPEEAEPGAPFIHIGAITIRSDGRVDVSGVVETSECYSLLLCAGRELCDVLLAEISEITTLSGRSRYQQRGKA
jgi:hypothetical protein